MILKQHMRSAAAALFKERTQRRPVIIPTGHGGVGDGQGANPATTDPAAGARPEPAAGGQDPARTTRVGQSSRKALSPHKGDIQGVFLALFAVVLALGIWFEDGGKVGVFFALLFRGLFGYGAYAVPLLVTGLALALFWRPAAKDDMVAGRVTIGLLAVLVGGLGLLHLAKGARRRLTPAVLQNSGGLVGAIIAAPLARLLSTWGAARCSPGCCSSAP
jgi:hypothetical protein